MRALERREHGRYIEENSRKSSENHGKSTCSALGCVRGGEALVVSPVAARKRAFYRRQRPTNSENSRKSNENLNNMDCIETPSFFSTYESPENLDVIEPPPRRATVSGVSRGKALLAHPAPARTRAFYRRKQPEIQ
jgi:hypothetical protein